MSGLVEQGRSAGSFTGAVTPTPTLLSHLLSVTQTLGWGVKGARVGSVPLVGVQGLEEGLLTPRALFN